MIDAVPRVKRELLQNKRMVEGGSVRSKSHLDYCFHNVAFLEKPKTLYQTQYRYRKAATWKRQCHWKEWNIWEDSNLWCRDYICWCDTGMLFVQVAGGDGDRKRERQNLLMRRKDVKKWVYSSCRKWPIRSTHGIRTFSSCSSQWIVRSNIEPRHHQGVFVAKNYRNIGQSVRGGSKTSYHTNEISSSFLGIACEFTILCGNDTVTPKLLELKILAEFRYHGTSWADERMAVWSTTHMSSPHRWADMQLRSRSNMPT